MQLDDSFYMEIINCFKFAFQENFSNEILLKNEFHNFNHMGNFTLIYNYLPLNYSIIVENELRTFTITIEDDEDAKNSLYRIEKYDNQLNESNIKKAIKLLKKILEKNEFDLYLYSNKKLYKKNSNGLKRIKDIKDIS